MRRRTYGAGQLFFKIRHAIVLICSHNGQAEAVTATLTVLQLRLIDPYKSMSI